MGSELQTIPARHGVATFVPAGQTIKIINTSGTQVVDTWAFALPKPEVKAEDQDQADTSNEQADSKDATREVPQARSSLKKKNKSGESEFPSQEEAEQATRGHFETAQKEENETERKEPQGSTWGSYVPSLGSWTSTGAKTTTNQAGQKQKVSDAETEQQKNSRTWASYFPSGQGFSSYIPKQASDSVSAFAASHHRDQSKSYLGQLRDFSKTPVGAAGLAAVTGSGYGGSLYAAYQAWNAHHAANEPMMEFLSMAHTRVATLHLRPQVGDTLVTNVREPILTLLEDTSGGIHDTLIAACDPTRYRDLGVEKWEEHGSCAENLVLALKELNERAGLKGAKSVGADVTVNNVPAPLNLFMNVPWDENASLSMDGPKCRKEGYVRFRAESDVVVVMSACPQDVLDINAKKLADAHFIVEDEEMVGKLRKTQVPLKKGTSQGRKRQQPPKRLPLVQENQEGDTTVTPPPARKKPVPPLVKPQNQPSSKVDKPRRTSKVKQSVLPINDATSKSTAESMASTTNRPADKKRPRKLASGRRPSDLA